ncbi:MAG: sigma-70 family RNA polymerase sigma factor [Gemmatimonadales bacterium]
MQPLTADTSGRSGSGLTDRLWERYRRDQDPSARAQLLTSYLGLVHHAAHQLARRSGDYAELDDLVSAGTLGLVQALEGFDHTRGLAFSSFAVPRIRGAMLDELRARNWQPRGARARARRVAEARERLQQELGRVPTPAEMADALQVDLETYWQWNEDLQGGRFVSMDPVATPEQGSLAERLADEDGAGPADLLDQQETVAVLRRALDRLPEKERLVVSLSFYEQVNLKQIGELLHVSESRVSQIRTRALQRLREYLAEGDLT